jgi:hypothetical protein
MKPRHTILPHTARQDDMKKDKGYLKLHPLNWITLVAGPDASSIRRILFDFLDETHWLIEIRNGQMVLTQQTLVEQQQLSSEDNRLGMVFHHIRGDAPELEDGVAALFSELKAQAASAPGFDPHGWEQLAAVLRARSLLP